MKPLFFLMFIITTIFAKAQPYQSLFGSTSTRWNVAWMGIDYLKTDSVYFEKDTIVNGTSWKKIRKNTPTNPNFRGGLLREDMQTGKVWYKSLGTVDTSTVLAFDFSLNKGDTFNIRNPWGDYTVAQKTVDTTYTANGRKVIVFKAPINQQMQLAERVTFIEVIGSNLGPMYKDFEAGAFAPYLLCAYKNGIQTYVNTYFNGQCWMVQTAIREVTNTTGIKVYPTAFTDYVFIDNKSNYRFTKVALLNTVGAEVYSTAFKNRIDIPKLPSGVYYLCLFTQKGYVYKKPIIHY